MYGFIHHIHLCFLFYNDQLLELTIHCFQIKIQSFRLSVYLQLILSIFFTSQGFSIHFLWICLSDSLNGTLSNMKQYDSSKFHNKFVTLPKSERFYRLATLLLEYYSIIINIFTVQQQLEDYLDLVNSTFRYVMQAIYIL